MKARKKGLADVNGTKLFVEIVGRGPPILFMHGGLGVDHSYFQPWLEQLADAYTLVFYDHRENGRSVRSEDPGRFDHETFVDDAEGLRRLLNIERLILFGHSYGACVALSYAIRHPEHLLGLAICSGTPAFDYPEVMMEGVQGRASDAQLRILYEEFAAPFADDEAFAAAYRAILPLYFHRERHAVITEVAKRIRYSARALYRWQQDCMPSFDVTTQVDRIDVPTQLFFGAHDWVTPVIEGGLRLHMALRHSHMHVFPQSAHFPFIEEPKSFLSTLRPWLDELAADLMGRVNPYN